jgi:hypothetical protein
MLMWMVPLRFAFTVQVLNAMKLSEAHQKIIQDYHIDVVKKHMQNIPGATSAEIMSVSLFTFIACVLNITQ